MADFNNEVTFNPSKGIKNNTQPRVLKASYGDGYTQRTADGINNIIETWNLSFTNRSYAEAETLLNFLEARGGVESFTWTPPGASTSIKVICYKWDSTYVAEDARSVTCTFTKVFE